ncbi:MAG: DUF4830 domain-containing protein [Clostridia bacterium]
MVFSVKANKGKIISVILIIVVIICGVLFLPKQTVEEVEVYYGETNTQRIEFLESFGWDVSDQPIDTREVTIPAEFSDVYTNYNTMQLAQGFDLLPYSGIICTQYIYQITNYPNEESQINATLLVCDGVIIGGDVYCSDVDGFMHGFDIDSQPYTYSQNSTEETDNIETAGQVVESTY